MLVILQYISMMCWSFCGVAEINVDDHFPMYSLYVVILIVFCNGYVRTWLFQDCVSMLLLSLMFTHGLKNICRTC